MIHLYTWSTPNGYKVPIILEEMGLPYELHMVNIGKGEQHTEEYQKMNPNEKIPVMVDEDGPNGEPITLFESGAILWYLAEKTGKFLPKDEKEKYVALEWLFFQMASVGPMMGQLAHFHLFAPKKIDYALDRYFMETSRLFGVLEGRLNETEYLGGGEYGIADIATWPWVRNAEKMDISLEMYPALSKWAKTIEGRPAVLRALEKVDDAKEKIG